MLRLAESRTDGSHRIGIHHLLIVGPSLGVAILGVVAADQLMQQLERIDLSSRDVVGPGFTRVASCQGQDVLETIATCSVGKRSHNRSGVAVVLLHPDDVDDRLHDPAIARGDTTLFSGAEPQVAGQRIEALHPLHAERDGDDGLVVLDGRASIGKHVVSRDAERGEVEVGRAAPLSLVHRLERAFVHILHDVEPCFIELGIEERGQAMLSVEQPLHVLFVRTGDDDGIGSGEVPVSRIHQRCDSLDPGRPHRAVALIVLGQQSHGVSLGELAPVANARGNRQLEGRAVDVLVSVSEVVQHFFVDLGHCVLVFVVTETLARTPTLD